jgi:hypothetical protein
MNKTLLALVVSHTELQFTGIVFPKCVTAN